MLAISLQVSDLAKAYNRRTIFSNINFSVHQYQSFAITGCNGSGKSTLIKILAGVLRSSSGESTISLNDKSIPREDVHLHIGMVAPYLQLYEEFTAWENLDLCRKLRGIKADDSVLEDLLQKMNLYERRWDFVRTYSSGMKQRLKYAFAILHQPEILLLDEPTANLDAPGKNIVYEIVREQKRNNIAIIATNDIEDLQHCDDVLNLDTMTPGAGGRV